MKLYNTIKINNHSYYINDEDGDSCYLIIGNTHALLIDLGLFKEPLLPTIKNITNKELIIVCTHGHFDHIGAIDELVEKYNCPVYIHQDDYEMIYNDQLNLSNYYGELKIKSKVTAVDKNIDIGEFHFEFLHLPGHTIGSCFIILKNYHVIFSGDVLFKNGIGRFDFPTSSSTDTRNSIKKIKEIKDDYEIYPGHGELTTLIQEKLNNPYLQ